MAVVNGGKGKPQGARTGTPVISLLAYRRALKNVQARAKEGSPEDERLIVQSFLAQTEKPFAFLPGFGLNGWVHDGIEPDSKPIPGLLNWTPPKDEDHGKEAS